MDGRLTLEDGAAIHDFLLLFSINRAGLYSYGSQKLMRRVWRLLAPTHHSHPTRPCTRPTSPPPSTPTPPFPSFLPHTVSISSASFSWAPHSTTPPTAP